MIKGYNYFSLDFIYHSKLEILDNFEQPTEKAGQFWTAVEKFTKLKSSVHYRLRNCQIKSVKSFGGHPLIEFAYFSVDNSIFAANCMKSFQEGISF